MMGHSHCVMGDASTRMNEKVNEPILMMEMWFRLAQLQNPARSPTTTIKENPALLLAKQGGLKATAATPKGSQQVTLGRFKIDAILLYHLALLGNS